MPVVDDSFLNELGKIAGIVREIRRCGGQIHRAPGTGLFLMSG